VRAPPPSNTPAPPVRGVVARLRREKCPPQPAWQNQDPGLAFFAGLVVVNATLGARVARTGTLGQSQDEPGPAGAVLVESTGMLCCKTTMRRSV
jgi:hypothetical protein